ncbi:MAG TPA: adenylate/guanylate cyclase domain-containing protein [Flexivirga sp.]|uniref:adenylate/guanylate cyclase domain-containing protein n=1 Tax=Flexivirga sp. TaxID=1962927 RepID=UPI002CFF78D4|nr:adenylate/guanylate cyclase domain-containing protein [Flexivirga sp.]HWC24701.1 adenylate/guanylate cyclase domain-containing protein [Flexivirga sp.]
MSCESDRPATALQPFASRLAAEWLTDHPDLRHRRLDCTMVFADISGFTALTERLARRGRVGAELMSDTLDLTFGTLLAPAFRDGADLLKWGGDAVLLLFRGEGHARWAAHAAHRMRAELRGLVRGRGLPVPASLRMSIGVHSGGFDVFFVGDPGSHRELLVAGPETSHLAAVEQACGAGQILLSTEAAALLPATALGEAVPVGDSAAWLLRSCPQVPGTPPDVRAGPSAAIADTLPPPIRAHLQEEAMHPEHRSIAVGFVQFLGSDQLLRDSDPEAAAEAVHQIVARVQRSCLEHGVTFFESDIAADGGKIMLTSGAPHSTGHHVERMLRTATRIAAHDGALGVRVGVNTGHVFAGDFGPAIRRTYSIKGDAVNLAARLLGHAEPGQVVATEAAAAACDAELVSTALAPFTVKGKRDPIHAVVVHSVLDRHLGRVETPFVGRADELATLSGALAAAMQQCGSVVDVVGEPGIGKSRLVAELPVPEGMTTHVTTVSSYDTGMPYIAVRSLLRSVLGIQPHDTAEAIALRLAGRVQQKAPELLPWLPLLGIPLDLDLRPTREVQELDPKFRRGRIEEVTVALLAALLTDPTLLLFEDTHLMDEASSALLHRLAAESHRQSWCLMITRRHVPIGYEPVLSAPTDLRVTLAAVSPEAALELLESVSAARRPSRRLLEAMAERADGNPLFLTSLGSMTDAPAGSDEELPDSVEAVLIADIDRLTPANRTLLRIAAVVGSRFDPALVAQLRPGLTSAAELPLRLAEFVRPVESGMVEFRHAMVRDVAYAGLPFRLRREAHEQVAVALEQSPDRTTATPALLSMHFHAAGLADKAWSYSLRAGDEARAKYAYGQAAAFYARALDAGANRPGTTPAARSAAYVSLGESLDMAGDSAGALTAFRRARRDLRTDVVATAEVLYKEARITLRLGRYQPALAQLTRALRLLEGVDGPAAAAVRATLATRYGFCRHLQRRATDALRWGRLGVQWAEESGDRTVIAHAYNALHLAYGASTVPEDRPYGQLALALYEQLDDLSGQALTVNNLAIDAYNNGRWDEAVDGFARVAGSFRRLGDDANEATALYNRADVLVTQHRHADALPVLDAALRLALGVDDEELIGLTYREQARARAGVGDRSEAWRLFDEARTVLDGLHLTTEVILLDAARAEALLETGRPAEALALVDDALSAARARAADTLARLHRIRAHALVAQGLRDEAAAAALAGLDQATGDFGGFEPALLRLALADATQDTDLRDASHRALSTLGVSPPTGPGASAPT